jgi:hypothetical protein
MTANNIHCDVDQLRRPTSAAKRVESLWSMWEELSDRASSGVAVAAASRVRRAAPATVAANAELGSVGEAAAVGGGDVAAQHDGERDRGDRLGS